MSAPIRVLVTGAAGQIGYSLVHQIARGDVFGDKQSLVLVGDWGTVLLDIAPMAPVLEGVVFELQDCALPLLHEVIASTDEQAAFKDIDAAFLVGAMPRKEGMERKDLLAANVKIFKSQGTALANHAKPTCKVIVVGNPANTNAYICAKYAAPKIPAKNITAMTRLDHNRSMAQIALRCGRHSHHVKNVIIWGNHSSTQFPDVRFAKVDMGGKEVAVPEAVKDDAWLQGEFISLIQKRGGVIIQKRKLSSAMSAAKAACDHMHDWIHGTHGDTIVSMAVPSDGSYGITQGIVYSFPVKIANGEYTIVKDLPIDDFSRGKMDATLAELTAEAKDAEEATK